MKFTLTLTTILFAIALSNSYALDNEELTAEQEVFSYCQEQADLADIQDPQEKAAYVKDCSKSFTSQYEETPVLE